MSIFFGKPSSEANVDGVKPAPPSVALYVAGALVQIAGLAAVGYQIAEPTFVYFTIGLTLLGTAVSFLMRRRGVSPRLLRLGTLFIALTFLYIFRGSGFFGVILPAEIQGGGQELLLITALAFCATFATFLWLTDEAVIFTCVWSIAMIGLTGTINVNRELIFCFVAFLAASVFLLIHQNTLAQSSGLPQDEPAGADSPRTLRHGRGGILRAQLLASLIAWVGSLVLGFLIAIPVQMVGKNLSLASVIQRLKVPPTQLTRGGSRPRLNFDNLQNFPIGVGPVDDDPTERMYVLSEGPHYWRGRVFDQYNGHGWGTSISTNGIAITPVSTTPDKDDLLTFNLQVFSEPRRATRRYTHRYRQLFGGGGPLYHAAEPLQVRAGVMSVTEREDNTIGAGRAIGDQYEVTSEVSEPRPGDLRRSKANYTEEIRLRYIAQAVSNEALASLSQEAIAGARSNAPYDKAQAIRRFIAQRCVYTRDARAVPADRDSVDFFMNESREGYCDLYATAMTVLCRYARIPARVATGFAPGSPAARENLDAQNLKVAPGDNRQWYVLRGSDMHSWCEVYFVGYGWIPFDATVDTAAITTPPVTPQPVVRESGWRDLLRRGLVPVLLIGAGVVGVLYVAASEIWSRLSGRGNRTENRGAASAATDALSRQYRKTAKLIGRRGPTPDPVQTPGEYARSVRHTLGDSVADAFQPLVQALETASYSPQAPTEEEVRRARGVHKAVRAALRALPRRAVLPDTDAISPEGESARAISSPR